MEAIIFDIDDTLIPSGDIEEASLNAAFEVIKQYTNEDLDTFIKKMREIRRKGGINKFYYTPEHFQKYLEVEKMAAGLEIVATRMYVKYTDERLNKTKLYDGVMKVLEFLKKKGIIMLVVSKGDKWIQYEKLIRTNIIRFFQNAYISMIEDKAPSLLQAIKDYDLDPKETVYIGDKPSEDIAGAEKTGLKAIWIKQGRHAKEESLAYKPYHTVNNCGELLDFLEKELSKTGAL